METITISQVILGKPFTISGSQLDVIIERYSICPDSMHKSTLKNIRISIINSRARFPKTDFNFILCFLSFVI